MNKGLNNLTADDCRVIRDAGYEIYINDGLVTTNYKDDEEELHHNIPDDLATPMEYAFS